MDKIICEGLVKEFLNEVTIKYENIEFKKGRTYLILGSSGCGKSTLLNMMAGITEPTAGAIKYTDSDGNETVLNRMSQKERDRFRILNIGYIYQDFKLIEDMTVEDNLNVLRLETKKLKDIDECLSALGIREKKKTKIANLSGGQKQRVAIGRAIIKDAPVLFADEPTGNLNMEVGKQIIRDLTETAKDRILIAVSHDKSLAEYFTDVIRLDDIAKSTIS